MTVFMPDAQTLFIVVQIVVLGSPAVTKWLASHSAGHKLITLHRIRNPNKNLRTAYFL
jgi:hypothetical protein